jgi:glycosyltransferase involved in cell wall biosynthesis
MLTVLFATRNRAEILPEVLNCYRRLKPPTGGWKLVIVDNGSTDQTRDIIYSYQHRLELTYLFEPQPGKNVALNTGLARIAGDLVLLTDDDAFPHKDWLVRMRAAADAHPDYGIFGGRIIPRWEILPHSWILSWVPLGAVFSLTDPLALEGPVSDDNVFGPNMAVRADIFARGYRFDPEIGPRNSSYPMGSETEFVKRLLRAGFLAWYCRNAAVEHFIPRSHMLMSWILGRAVRFGRGEYRIAVLERGPLGRQWLGVPRHIFREMVTQQVQIVTAVLRLDWEKLFSARWRFNYLLGQAIEARLMRAGGRGWSVTQDPIRR